MTTREEILERLRSLDLSRREDIVNELLQLLLADPDFVLPEELVRLVEELIDENTDDQQPRSPSD